MECSYPEMEWKSCNSRLIPNFPVKTFHFLSGKIRTCSHAELKQAEGWAAPTKETSWRQMGSGRWEEWSGATYRPRGITDIRCCTVQLWTGRRVQWFLQFMPGVGYFSIGSYFPICSEESSSICSDNKIMLLLRRTINCQTVVNSLADRRFLSLISLIVPTTL